jgi:transposase
MSDGKILIEHLSAGEVYSTYRKEGETVRRSHLQVIWRLLEGDAALEVSRVTGFSARWIAKLIDRWNAHGLDGLGDGRRGNRGAKPLLDAAGLAALAEALEQSPEDGGLWSGRQVANWMSGYLGREVSPKRGLDYLHRLDFSLQRPRPRHARAASGEEEAAFKKNSVKQWLRRGRRRAVGRSRSGPLTSIASA